MIFWQYERYIQSSLPSQVICKSGLRIALWSIFFWDMTLLEIIHGNMYSHQANPTGVNIISCKNNFCLFLHFEECIKSSLSKSALSITLWGLVFEILPKKNVHEKLHNQQANPMGVCKKLKNFFHYQVKDTSKEASRVKFSANLVSESLWEA